MTFSAEQEPFGKTTLLTSAQRRGQHDQVATLDVATGEKSATTRRRMVGLGIAIHLHCRLVERDLSIHRGSSSQSGVRRSSRLSRAGP